ncbi:hypothetical protein CLU96_1243 [Chryseobacterium sp. 52]|uniref:hypothetical protein n=1 Tax=Chryseobacterium sp. 52 TaxID=2035213 RepID=UPI000C17CAAC|nr:hypothetical protein [Chryseobacterium sp. 52]PIF44302.1 hypothetical protein CLU96_1243 [Chryseobacterium sp. 52]
MLNEILKKLSEKENLVFVGSVSLMLQGFDVEPKDIDIVVTDLNNLENYTEYETDSKFSFSGKRAYILGEICIDIFIEDELPEYTTINGLKCETIFCMKRYYYIILPLVDSYWQNVIKSKLKILK